MSYHDLEHGVVATQLKYHADGRGFSLHDLFRANPPIQQFHEGQVNVSTTMPGVVKAFHYHRKQSDRWACVGGDMHVITVDFAIRDIYDIARARIVSNTPMWQDKFKRQYGKELKMPYFMLVQKNGENLMYEPKIQHFYIGEKNPQMILIPPGVLHGYSPMYGKAATILYHVTEKYDQSNPDEYRLAWDAFGKELWEVKNE